MRRTVRIQGGPFPDPVREGRGGGVAADDPQVGDVRQGLQAGPPEPVLVGGLGDDGDLGAEQDVEGGEERVRDGDVEVFDVLRNRPEAVSAMPCLISSRRMEGQPSSAARARARVDFPDPGGPLMAMRRGFRMG